MHRKSPFLGECCIFAANSIETNSGVSSCNLLFDGHCATALAAARLLQYFCGTFGGTFAALLQCFCRASARIQWYFRNASAVLSVALQRYFCGTSVLLLRYFCNTSAVFLRYSSAVNLRGLLGAVFSRILSSTSTIFLPCWEHVCLPRSTVHPPKRQKNKTKSAAARGFWERVL